MIIIKTISQFDNIDKEVKFVLFSRDGKWRKVLLKDIHTWTYLWVSIHIEQGKLALEGPIEANAN